MTDDQARDPVPFASRYGLVRPLQGRYLAGVCAALGRATGTDPVLWRVVLAVLVCFMGTGAVLYLIAWLLIPEEGDTASPLEGMLGRGYSSMSPMLVVVLGIIATFLLFLVLPRPLYVLLAGGTVLALLLLLNRVRTAAGTTAAPVPPAPPPAPAPAPAPVPAPVAAPAAGTAQAGYRPPFAPHGPFAGPPPPPPRPPRPPRERSALPAVAFFAVLVLLGALGLLDLTGALDVPAAGYLAGALAVVGAGLLTGAWLGRARSLIALGLVLVLALPVVHVAETVDPPENMGDLTWTPQSLADVEEEYALTFGSGLVDLRQVDFSGREVAVTIRIMFGDMRVAVPEEVAVEATVHNQLGDTTVFGRSHDEISGGVVRDQGSGDPADGTLALDLHVRLGSLEVHR